MKTLHVLRHAEAERSRRNTGDHDRPLAEGGRRAANAVAARLRGQGVELVLCSSSRRTRETLDELGDVVADATHVFEDDLYLASADRILRRLREIDDAITSVLVIGHNPGLQDLVVGLSVSGVVRQRVETRFPTGALATLRFDVACWADLAAYAGELTGFVTPRELP